MTAKLVKGDIKRTNPFLKLHEFFVDTASEIGIIPDAILRAGALGNTWIKE